MPIVRILRSLGFEQNGDITDYRGVDLDERIAAGDMELLTPKPVPSEQPIEEVTPEVQPIVETPEPTIEEVKAEVEGE